MYAFCFVDIEFIVSRMIAMLEGLGGEPVAIVVGVQMPMTISVARLRYKIRNQINISAQLRKRRRG